MRRAWLCIALLLLPAGCAVGPDYRRPEIDTPVAWRVDPREAADVINTAWWKQFRDPELNALIEIALRENKDLRIATARVEEFAARLGIARSDFFPQFGYDVSGSRDQASGDTAVAPLPGTDRITETYASTINVGWELDIWGRIRRATEAARADLLASEEGRRTVILTLVSSVATSYVLLRSLDRQLEISHETLDTRAESLRLFELKFRGGVISELELAQVRTEYEQAAVAIPALERQIAVLENSLSVLLGRMPGAIARGRGINELILPAVPAGVPSELLARRPDIRQSEQQLISANARIGVARAQYFPTISLTGLFGYASEELSDLFSSSAETWSAGGIVLGPIFTGGRISGGVRAAEAVQRQALHDYLRTIQTAFREVDDALVQTQKYQEQLVVQGRQVDALRDSTRLARLRFDNGYTSYIEVLDAERSRFEAELNYVSTQNNVYGSLVNIYKAMGGGWVVEAERFADAADYPGEDADGKPAPRGDASTRPVENATR